MSKPNVDLQPKTSPLLEGLSEYLRNPANYFEVQKKILDTFISTCAHSEMMEWAECVKCTAKMVERRKIIKKLGFKDAKQYMAWKKTHEFIKERFPLVDWNKNVKIQ